MHQIHQTFKFSKYSECTVKVGNISKPHKSKTALSPFSFSCLRIHISQTKTNDFQLLKATLSSENEKVIIRRVPAGPK